MSHEQTNAWTTNLRRAVAENELIARARAGDPTAERALYDSHVDRVFRMAFRMTGDEGLAQDVTQDTFVRAFERLDSFRGESAFGTWLFAIAHSMTLNTLRKVKRFRTREVELDEGLGTGDTTPQAEPDLREKLRMAIDQLPIKYRTVFIMHDVEGYKHHEIATATGVEVGTSKAQLSRARAKLRESLSEFAPGWAS